MCAADMTTAIDKKKQRDDDDNSSVSGSTGEQESSTDGDQQDKNRRETCTKTIKESMTRQETKNVSRVRIIFVLIMIGIAVAISTSVYFISTQSEQNGYEAEFAGAADKLKQSFEGLPKRVSSVAAISVAATIQGMAMEKMLLKTLQNWTSLNEIASETLADAGYWPFVTLASFQERAVTSRLLSGLLSISLNPIVTQEHRPTWERFSTREDEKNWIQEGLKYQSKLGYDLFEHNPPSLDVVLMTNVTRKSIFYYASDLENEMIVEDGPGPYLPSWQTSPVLMKSKINENLFRHKNGENMDTINMSITKQVAEFGHIHMKPYGYINDTNPSTAMYATLRSFVEGSEQPFKGEPMSQLYTPVYNHFEKDDTRSVVAMTSSVVHWKQYFRKILPEGTPSIQVVLDDTCFGQYTYVVHGPVADPVGSGDIHDNRYENLVKLATLANNTLITDGTVDGLEIDLTGCFQTISFYPTEDFYTSYNTSTPIIITSCVAMVFGLSIFLFLFYDLLVQKRQMIVLDKAAHSAAIVSSLFPRQVRDQLLQESKEKEQRMNTNGNRLQNFLAGNHENDGNEVTNSRPIAELFPNCTVMFADLAGFTSWSSTRDPTDVFVLLQTLYQSFDLIAKRRNVFKVETIGDCYVAVTGLPEAQEKHAVIMARFAWDCRYKMYELTRELAVKIGPECSELQLRTGLNSGPVTGGVLRGDRARFQLFGDTVNTAARMETTGTAGKVHISTSTANALTIAGKESWIIRREEMVEAKGKGLLQTYWLRVNDNKSSETASTTTSTNGNNNFQGLVFDKVQKPVVEDKQELLIRCMTELLRGYVREIINKRGNLLNVNDHGTSMSTTPESGRTCLEDIDEILPIAQLDTTNVRTESSKIDLLPETVADLREFVSLIANMYRENQFHNFEHACHVTMTLNKLLKRIVALEANEEHLKPNAVDMVSASSSYNNIYGFNADPVLAFALLFSALIHDVDHRGCSNKQLVKEEPSLGIIYKNKSVAEQNSFEIAWNLLISPRFDNLRRVIFGNQEELERFRKFVAVSVLATDIMDSELNNLRKSRWEKAFEISNIDNNTKNRKATIIVEHLMQASDVAHTMQHWQVYLKWNRRLFREMYAAFRCGRMGVDPSTFWYQGEISFFDNYVIPLARKLKECNVFGVSSDECLNYAEVNRVEWLQRGEALVTEYMEENIRPMKSALSESEISL